MSDRMSRIVITIIGTLVIWFAVIFINVITGDHLIRNFAAILSFVFMVIAWLAIIITESEISQQTQTAQPQKAKRDISEHPSTEPRLALLLDLMDEDERRQLKARLMDELSADGEISLANLLATHDSDAADHHEKRV